MDHKKAISTILGSSVLVASGEMRNYSVCIKAVFGTETRLYNLQRKITTLVIIF